MAKDVIMPVLGMNQDTAVLLSWLKQEGDQVTEGEPIMEVETDKATMELDAPASGTLAGVRAAAGDEVKVGSVVAVILGEGEEAPAAGAGTAPPPAPAADSSADERSDEGEGPREPATTAARDAGPAPQIAARPNAGGSAVAAPASGMAPASGIVPASPKARRLAAENGVQLEALRGSGRGPEGAVLAADVMEAARSGIATAATPVERVAAPPLRFERVVAAGALLDALAWARDHAGSAEAPPLVAGDLVARFLAAVWARHPLGHGEAGAELRYRRVADGGASEARLPADTAASLPAIAATRSAVTAPPAPSGAADADPTSATAAELALLDLSAARAELDPESVTHAGALVNVVVGRLEDRVLAVDGAPAVARAMKLTFAFDPARVALAEAAAFSDRVIALVEEPRALALLY